MEIKMKAIKLTGEQAYNIGIHHKLYRKNLNDSFELIMFESYENDGFILARDERDFAVILIENRVYTFYQK